MNFSFKCIWGLGVGSVSGWFAIGLIDSKLLRVHRPRHPVLILTRFWSSLSVQIAFTQSPGYIISFDFKLFCSIHQLLPGRVTCMNICIVLYIQRNTLYSPYSLRDLFQPSCSFVRFLRVLLHCRTRNIAVSIKDQILKKPNRDGKDWRGF